MYYLLCHSQRQFHYGCNMIHFEVTPCITNGWCLTICRAYKVQEFVCVFSWQNVIKEWKFKSKFLDKIQRLFKLNTLMMFLLLPGYLVQEHNPARFPVQVSILPASIDQPPGPSTVTHHAAVAWALVCAVLTMVIPTR